VATHGIFPNQTCAQQGLVIIISGDSHTRRMQLLDGMLLNGGVWNVQLYTSNDSCKPANEILSHSVLRRTDKTWNDDQTEIALESTIR
jgi:hypothetical protein